MSLQQCCILEELKFTVEGATEQWEYVVKKKRKDQLKSIMQSKRADLNLC